MSALDELSALAAKTDWQGDDITSVDALSKELDISGTLEGADEAPELWQLAFTVLHKAFSLETSRAIRLKRLNCLFKAADHVTPSPGGLDALLAAEIASTADKHPAAVPMTTPAATVELPLTVLFHEGPIARAYLETMHHLGFRPRKIIHLVSSRDLVGGKPVGRWLPGGLRTPYAASLQKSRIHHWPKKLTAQYGGLVGAIKQAVESAFGFPRSVMDEANALHGLSRYSDDVEALPMDRLNDPALHDHLSGLEDRVFLYTGGGIVPAALLAMPGHRFMHIHPGYLPAIRGADCVLWSALLSGGLSASCFYMALGIDSGAVIAARRLPALRIEYLGDAVDTPSLYRAVFSYLDPWVRAFVLAEVIRKHRAFDDIMAEVQREADGVTYHFMHPKLQAAAIAALFA